MAITLNPYLGFRGNAREAIEFYRNALGGEAELSTFTDLHAEVDPSEAEWIMHGVVRTSNGLTLMASDTPTHMDYHAGDNFSVSLNGSGEDDATLRGYWNNLLDGGTIVAPLETAPWGAAFGMVKDRFGVTWLINIDA